MLPERAVDLDAGLAITVFACLNCGRRKAADQEPRPLTARYWRDDRFPRSFLTSMKPPRRSCRLHRMMQQSAASSFRSQPLPASTSLSRA